MWFGMQSMWILKSEVLLTAPPGGMTGLPPRKFIRARSLVARNAKYAGLITGVLLTGRTGGCKRFVWGRGLPAVVLTRQPLTRVTEGPWLGMRSVRAAWCPKLCRSPEFSSIVATFSCTFGHPLTTASPWLRSSPPAETVKPIRAIIRPDSSQFGAISISPALACLWSACVRAN